MRGITMMTLFSHPFRSLAVIALVAPACLPACSNHGRTTDGGDTDEGCEGESCDVQEETVGDGVEEEAPRPCLEDADCDDGNPCNGIEWCDPAVRVCAMGEAAADGSICSLEPRLICVDRMCVESTCGDEVVDTGTDEFCEPPGVDDCDDACGLICEGDPDCLDDENPCNGEEYCNLDTSRCSRRNPDVDGTICSLEPRKLCLGRLCTVSICGDGYVDEGGGEFCEPPYVGGCGTTCVLVCGAEPDCFDDGNPCDGEEYCNLETSRCSRRGMLENGTVCGADPRRICLAASCAESICGDGFLDAEAGEFCEPPGTRECDGECRLACGDDPECLDDGNMCNGEEYCNTDTGLCSRRDVPGDGAECQADPRMICLGGVCSPPIARVQFTTCANGSATSLSCALGAAPGDGDTMIAVIGTRGASDDRVTSITQSGAVWSRQVQQTNVNGTTVEIWAAFGIAGADPAITVNLAESLKASAIIAEYSSISLTAALDRTATLTGGSDTPSTGTTAATTAVHELWIGGMNNNNRSSTYSGETNGFVEVAESFSLGGAAGTANNAVMEEKIVETIGSAGVAATFSRAREWTGAIATFKAGAP
jgi:hypothetical protein